MHTRSDTTHRISHRVRQHATPVPQESAVHQSVPYHPILPDLRSRALRLVRNPLFLVVVTWLVMAGLLVVEIAAGN